MTAHLGNLRILSLLMAASACQKSDLPTEPVALALLRPIVFSARTGATGTDIFLAKSDGTDPIELTFSGSTRHPSWSPDSKHIAFEVFSDPRLGTPPSHDAVFVMDADGSHQHALSNVAYDQFGPVWSPDGSQVAYNSMDGIDIVALDGIGIRRLTMPIEFQSFISWSPNGRSLAYTCITASTAQSRKVDICSVSSAGFGIRRLSFFDNAVDPSWSPDGAEIAFIAKGPLFVMNADGSNTRQVSSGAPRNRYAPRWSSDATHLIYGNWNSAPPFNAGLYTIRLDGTADLPFGIQDSYSGTADWSRLSR